MTTSSSGPWLTRQAFDRLNAELEHLKGPARMEVTQRIAAARDEGDLKENGGYHAAREEQGKQEARISELTELLRNATVGDSPADDGVVEPGMVVEISMNGKKVNFLLGNREVAEGTDLEVYSDQSPLGGAINGTKVGDKVEFEAPNGKTIAVEILKAQPFAS